MKYEKFFFFGCWNYDNCGKTDNRNSVINMIASEKYSYDFGIVAGDNIYSRKMVDESGIETKHMYDETIGNISILLKKLVKPISPFLYVILGNHDEESDCILKREVEQISMVPNTRFFLRNTRHSIVERPLAYYIYLNTNEQHIDDLKLFLISLLNEDLDKQKWLIFIGHEPIYSLKYKEKEGKIKKLTELDEGLIQIFYDLQVVKNLKKMVYLCADTHNFQLLNIRSFVNNFNLPVLVSGTGGAKLDNIFQPDINIRNNGEYNTNQIESPNKSFGTKDKLYRIRLEHGLKKHGYSSITVTKTSILVQFKTCTDIFNYKIKFKHGKTFITKNKKKTKNKSAKCIKIKEACLKKTVGCIKTKKKKTKK